nr:MAG TPA: hypothetical protein [Caudoviricetes sp.]
MARGNAEKPSPEHFFNLLWLPKPVMGKGSRKSYKN